jgi:hypothetical protein
MAQKIGYVWLLFCTFFFPLLQSKVMCLTKIKKLEIEEMKEAMTKKKGCTLNNSEKSYKQYQV